MEPQQVRHKSIWSFVPVLKIMKSVLVYISLYISYILYISLAVRSVCMLIKSPVFILTPGSVYGNQNKVARSRPLKTFLPINDGGFIPMHRTRGRGRCGTAIKWKIWLAKKGSFEGCNWRPIKSQCCTKAVPIRGLKCFFSLFLKDTPLLSFEASQIPRFFVRCFSVPEKKMTMATSSVMITLLWVQITGFPLHSPLLTGNIPDTDRAASPLPPESSELKRK